MTAALVVLAIVVFLLVLYALAAVKVLREYERAIVFRLGRLFPQPKGPGLMPFTVMCSGASSRARARVKPSNAALAEE